MGITDEQARIPSAQYGWYEPSYDRFPNERRWAKRMALYRLKQIIKQFSLDYETVFVWDFQIIEKLPDINDSSLLSHYTWGWKCLITGKKKDSILFTQL